MNFVLLDPDRKKEYFEALERLINKQQIFYARAKLSDDPEAKSVVDTMKQGVIMLGATPDTSIESMFQELLDKVQKMKDQLESGTEGWHPTLCLLLCLSDRESLGSNYHDLEAWTWRWVKLHNAPRIQTKSN